MWSLQCSILIFKKKTRKQKTSQHNLLISDKGSDYFLITSLFLDHFILSPFITASPNSCQDKNSVHLLAHLMMTTICTCKWRFQCGSVIHICAWTGMKNKLNCQENCNESIRLLGASWPSWLNVWDTLSRKIICWCAVQNKLWRKSCSLLFQSIYPFKPL